jgi:hypothetical protein
MRRSFAWLACGSGALFAFRWLRLRRRRPETPAADPAEELRQKLQESRAEAASPEPEPPQTPREAAAEVTSADDRRREVHERGRAAIEQMRERGGEPG